jgi:arylsulfatase A-like enzyme
MHKLLSLSFLPGYIALASHALGQSEQPNILYIYSDDQSYRTVSCYPRSYNFANTPNIDRLAEQGAAAHQHGTSWDWSVVWDHGAYAAAGGYYYDQKVMINGAPQVDLNGYSTDRYTDYTEQFIQERADDPDSPPWFHWLAYAGVHGHYTPTDRHIGMPDDAPQTAIPEDV